ncbi:COG0863 DNA modification methylase [uncultured Caudovirales phage]|uniref:COG0863 DNA modification methylase n=1 Tax=uncultured Caudovirales phage TaxID=2100421 RepID=A0A6J5N2C8_9CAUD|nr:COG0863 DNA modification methylase [uncultured Caudovirales phage]CAB4157427.1 COG0863 DNA modification methylase [uncultured Caudovirales phage]CAB5225428.1 COG0863 DNA modification methylase [uncultured Caudovirales phage]
MSLRDYKSVPVGDLVKYKANSRTHSDEQIAKIVRSINEFGFTNPLLIDENNCIIAGHGRLAAAQVAGIDELPCIVLSGLSDEQKAALVIADNKIALDAGWDREILLGQFEFLKGFDYDLTLTGFDLEELSEIFPDELPDAFCGEDDLPLAVETQTQLGDLWLLGDHRLLCGDSTVATDVERLMNGNKADVVFTDPPYNVASDSKNFASDCSKAMNDLSNAEWDKDFDIKPALLNAINSSQDSATYYVWSSHFLIADIWDILKEYCDFYGYLVWSKPNPMPSLSKRHPTWNTELCAYGTRGTKRKVNFPKSGHFLSCREVVKKSDGSHPTQKPIELIEPLVEFSSTKGQLVLDLFGGSGSTLIACEKLKRKCFMMELSPEYCDVIIKRYENYSGKKAIREAKDGQTEIRDI